VVDRLSQLRGVIRDGGSSPRSLMVSYDWVAQLGDVASIGA
jgi:hypothetical protein